MSKILLSTSYFPPIEYMAKIIEADEVIIEAHENFQKQSYRNRCYIAGPNGKQMLNIPIVKPQGNHTTIQEVLLSTPFNWKEQHWNSIETAYNSSPFLLYYEDEIKEVFFDNHKTLWDFNWALLNLSKELLQIETLFTPSDKYISKPESSIDLRNKIHPKKPSTLVQEPYIQVFSSKYDFIPNLSLLDLLFNLGPESGIYLRKKQHK